LASQFLFLLHDAKIASLKLLRKKPKSTRKPLYDENLRQLVECHARERLIKAVGIWEDEYRAQEKDVHANTLQRRLSVYFIYRR